MPSTNFFTDFPFFCPYLHCDVGGRKGGRPLLRYTNASQLTFSTVGKEDDKSNNGAKIKATYRTTMVGCTIVGQLNLRVLSPPLLPFTPAIFSTATERKEEEGTHAL